MLPVDPSSGELGFYEQAGGLTPIFFRNIIIETACEPYPKRSRGPRRPFFPVARSTGSVLLQTAFAPEKTLSRA
jgi:hypothetical protein